MSFKALHSGSNLPASFNVLIEIPAQSDPVKYEIDKESGILRVDRFVGTGMRYPANYGFVPQTMTGDGDPLDVLVITPFPLLAGSVIECRALAMLEMQDESGQDMKVLAVPTVKICPMLADWNSLADVPTYLTAQIEHFFAHYKALEPGKWVKIAGWQDRDAAMQCLSGSVVS